MADESIVFNGINAETGDYLLPAMSAMALANAIRGQPIDANLPENERGALAQELAWRQQQKENPSARPEEGVDPKELAQAGWGVVFPAGADGTVRAALAELLDYRKSQAGPLYKEFSAELGYRPNDTKSSFLARSHASAGWVKPTLMPYYLLLVGSPEEIPYRFQYQLDVQHAVGRLWFETLDEYRNYAHSVVAAEPAPARAPSLVFAGVQNPDDVATNLSATELVAPLAQQIAKDQPSWTVQTALAAETTKAGLLPYFGGAKTPALLFTASHGMGFPAANDRQFRHQGALLCQDWPGPKAHRGAIPPEFYLSADDIGDDAKLLGLLSFHFACYGAGTPKFDDYADMTNATRDAIAPGAFVAGLPRRLLGHPQGGALASVGHIERAWGCSFRAGGERQLSAFENMLKRLLEGHPIGSAMESFNDYYAEIATDLTESVETAKWQNPEAVDALAIAGLWTKHNDARAYAIVGDPAVRLNVAAFSTAQAGTPTFQPFSSLPGSPGGDAPTPTGTPPATNPASEPGPTPTGNAAPELAPTPTPQVTTQTGPTIAGASLVVRVDVEELPMTTGALTNPELKSFSVIGDKAGDLADAVADLVASVGRAIGEAFAEAASLRVVTYTSDNLEAVTFDREKSILTGGAKLRAVTRQRIDGDTLLLLPEIDGEVDDRIWAIHSEAVNQVQQYRADLVKSVLTAAAGLIPSVKL
jgi:hypothetical protein